MTHCGCGVNPDSGYFEPCCQEHEWEYVAYLELVAYQNYGVCCFCCVRPCTCPEFWECLRCGCLIDHDPMCSDCDHEDKIAHLERFHVQTLADVGMCEADFW